MIAALGDICISVGPDADDFRRATALAERHDLTLYDATCAAIAESHGAELPRWTRSCSTPGSG